MHTVAIIAAVVSYFGPGTTAHCYPATRHSAICTYSTPAANMGIETEDPARWSGVVRVLDRRFRVLLPGRSP
jgi:hypothetical protein